MQGPAEFWRRPIDITRFTACCRRWVLLTVEHLNLGIPTYDASAYYNAVKTAPTYRVSPQGDKLDRVLQGIGRN